MTTFPVSRAGRELVGTEDGEQNREGSVRRFTQVHCHFSEPVQSFPLKSTDLNVAALQRRRHLLPHGAVTSARVAARCPFKHLKRQDNANTEEEEEEETISFSSFMFYDFMIFSPIYNK